MKRVLVIGDSIADVYRDFVYKKQCPDAPDVPAAIQSGYDLRPGGAANVAVNLAALAPDISIDLASVLSPETARAVKRISSSRVDMYRSVIVDHDQSLVKERILINGMDSDRRSFIARLDNRRSIKRDFVESLEHLLDRYLAESPDVELVVLSDYDGGVLSERVLHLLAPFRDRLIVDTKRTDLSCFSSGERSLVSSVPSDRSLFAKLNEAEHRAVLLGDPLPERHFKYFVVTRGELGAKMIVYRDIGRENRSSLKSETVIMGSMSQVVSIPAASGVEAIDVCGCGDTFLAGIAAGLLRYNDPYEALSFANAAAATVVSQSRTAVASLQKALEMTGRTQ